MNDDASAKVYYACHILWFKELDQILFQVNNYRTWAIQNSGPTVKCWKSSTTSAKKKYNLPRWNEKHQRVERRHFEWKTVPCLSPDWFAIHSKSFSVALSLYFWYFSQKNPWRRFFSNIPGKFDEIVFFRWREGSSGKTKCRQPDNFLEFLQNLFFWSFESILIN